MSVVLVAEDEPSVLDAVCDVIEALGHEVVRARDGAQALSLARQLRPALIVTDHMMPTLSGLELCAAVRAEPALAATPVILMSAGRLPDAPGAADVFLRKPFDLEEIEHAVDAALSIKR